MYLSPYFHIDWYEHPKLPVYDCTNYTQRNMTLRSFYQVNSDHWTSMNSRSRAIPSKLASEIQGPWQGGNWAEALRFLFFFQIQPWNWRVKTESWILHMAKKITKKYADREATPVAREFCLSNQSGLKTVTREDITNTKQANIKHHKQSSSAMPQQTKSIGTNIEHKHQHQIASRIIKQNYERSS